MNNELLMPYAMGHYRNAMIANLGKTNALVELMLKHRSEHPLPWHRKFALWLYLRRWYALRDWWHCLWCCECGH